MDDEKFDSPRFPIHDRMIYLHRNRQPGNDRSKKRGRHRCFFMSCLWHPKIYIHLHLCFLNQTAHMSRNVLSNHIGFHIIATTTTIIIRKLDGCELPGGSVLRVEPSDPYHKVTAITPKSDSRLETQQKMESSGSKIGESSLGEKNIEDRGDPKESGATAGGANEEEDLDDFFASLE